MTTRRQKRLNELLFEELSLMIPGRLDDPRLADAVVTRVEVTQDLTTAKIYLINGAEDDAGAVAMLAALEHAQGRLRAELGALGLPRLPHLVFARDKQYESGERVLALLDHLHDDGTGLTDTLADDGDDHARPG